jgi:hypothetical protein
MNEKYIEEKENVVALVHGNCLELTLKHLIVDNIRKPEMAW